MKRWLAGSLLVVLAGVILAGVLLVSVINGNRDPIAVLQGHGGKIERNDQGDVVELKLAGTNITDTGLVHLKGFTKLEKLNLRFTKITDAGLVHLKGLTNLLQLILTDTQVTYAGVADLKKASPNFYITQ